MKNTEKQSKVEAISQARIDRKLARVNHYKSANAEAMAILQTNYDAIDSPTNRDGKNLAEAVENLHLETINTLANAIIRKIEIKRQISLTSHDKKDALQVGLITASMTGFFQHGETSRELYAAMSRAIEASLRVNRKWEVNLANETLFLIADELQAEEHIENVYLSLDTEAIEPLLQASFKADTSRNCKANYKKHKSFLLGCIRYASGGSADICSQQAFYDRKSDFMAYLKKGLLSLKVDNLESFFKNRIA